MSINPLYTKGMSAIVATIAIVLITIAAAAFLAGVIVPLVKNRLTEGTECIGYEEYFTFYEDFEYNCFRQENGRYYYALSVQAGSAAAEKVAKINGLRLHFLGSGESYEVNIFENQQTYNDTIRMLNTSVSLLKLPEEGGVRTYVYNSSVFYDSVELYPILVSERVCDKNDELRIQNFPCDPSLNLNLQ